VNHSIFKIKENKRKNMDINLENSIKNTLQKYAEDSPPKKKKMIILKMEKIFCYHGLWVLVKQF
jgi:hypothetical protein